MSRDIQRMADNDLRVLRDADRETPGETFEERKQIERRARHNGTPDGRRGRATTPVVQINFTIAPAVKARLVHECRIRDIKLYDFLREAVSVALDKLDGE